MTDFPPMELASSTARILAVTSLKITLQKSSIFHTVYRTAYKKQKRRSAVVLCSTKAGNHVINQADSLPLEQDSIFHGGQFDAFPHTQSLRDFPQKDLFRKVVMVRLDPMVVLQGMKEHQPLPENAFSTIRYLYEAGAKVVLVSSWNESRFCSESPPSTESISDFLSSMLGLRVVPVKFVPGYMQLDIQESKPPDILLLENLFRFKEERANCSEFAKELASGVDIFVNDAFSESHKFLASTVGIARFCYACMAGFYFEEDLNKLMRIIKTVERPYVAIIGGGNLADKGSALRILASTCDGFIFVGSMAFQILHALGVPVPMRLVDLRALKEAASIVESVKSRNIPLALPKDVWCISDQFPDQIELFSVDSILEGWQPTDIGPKSLEEMIDLLSGCKKVVWIGPLRFNSSKQDEGGTSKLAEALGTLSDCDVSFVGKMEPRELSVNPKSFSNGNFLKSAAVAWEVFKGRKLPGLMALDRAYPFLVDWCVAYSDPMRPLVVDIGSGNGLFLFGMANKRNEMNFLGLEMNAKLVDRCLNDVHRLCIQNVHFISTNATSTFRSIVSSYPGDLVLVTIQILSDALWQCPNPDFNKPENRWRMLQRSLVEAIADMLMLGGKVFLQSDIEAVALRMKNEFIQYGEGKLVVVKHLDGSVTDELGWLQENPFGVPSDWEKHVLERGDSMHRLLLSKV